MEDVAHVARVVECDHARAERQPCRVQILERQSLLQVFGRGERTRRSPEQDRAQFAADHAAGQVLQHVSNGDAEGYFVQTGSGHIARDAEQLRAGGFLGTKTVEGSGMRA